MTNNDTKMLLEIKKEDNKKLEELIADIESHKIFLIWIKIPPNKKLQPNEVRIINLTFEVREINNRFRNRIYLDVSSNLPFPVFWIFKKPDDYNMTNQYCHIIEDNKLKNRTTWKEGNNKLFYYDNTYNNATIIVKSDQTHLLVSYSFIPKPSIITLPTASIVLLTSFSLFLIGIQNYANDVGYDDLPLLFENLLDRNIELSLFIVSSSLVIPRFISNIETTPLSSHCETLYELKFYDEDHPNLDEFYDEVRLFWLHRIYDVEPIIIHNNNLIEFDNTWSSTNDYDCLSLIFACHETTIKAYTPGQVVYVSNTWNHMMDTSDTNPGYSKVTVP